MGAGLFFVLCVVVGGGGVNCGCRGGVAWGGVSSTTDWRRVRM